jgi:hypothetical protein
LLGQILDTVTSLYVITITAFFAEFV